MINNYRILSSNLNKFIQLQSLSIDCGSILTKLILSNFSLEKELRFYSFPTSELKENFQTIYDHYIKQSENSAIKVMITGMNNVYAKSIITNIWPSKVVLVEETEALAKGLKILAETFEESDVLLDVSERKEDENLYEFDENNKFVKRFNAIMNANIPNCELSDNGNIRKPAILIWAGAFVKFYLWSKDGSIEIISSTTLGGETFRGLARFFVESNDYKFITSIAENGKRENVDTQIYEIFSDDPKSPYGLLPPLLPIFSFGKCADQNMDIKILNHFDCLNSLTNLIFDETIFIATKLCQTYKISNVYICGDAFLSQIFHNHLNSRLKRTFKNIHGRILNCNYVVALGGLLYHQ